MAFPQLHPVERRGELRCGSVPAAGAQGCTAPATWHVAWRLEPKADFSLFCDRHMTQARQELVYADRHAAEINCDMPGTGWLLTDPSRCVPVDTDETATGYTRVDEHPDPD
ncbi:hypothetical protein VSR01_10695 [Actinacidiphila sp. DG2A-62]|uniref:hypothetical protein n=1 Tax=Actinacidiphila sp. DG2A-62 TaxID=3108821 RepID=UPI002DBAF643|nr:hypothetical protein [Actinacidiphila sp. DG2A-62]MEC3993986.1 hypothetical protein [Actinacidiphila sp. DG2A-62]